MGLNDEYSLNKIMPDCSVGVIPIVISPNDVCFSVADSYHETKPQRSVEHSSQIDQTKKQHSLLNGNAIQKMICRFLTEKQMPKEKLARALGITASDLKQVCSKNMPQTLIPKINLPLIKLYCRTKF